jgi:hypothetical protein
VLISGEEDGVRQETVTWGLAVAWIQLSTVESKLAELSPNQTRGSFATRAAQTSYIADVNDLPIRPV